MTELRCGVESCDYNRDYFCARTGITVEGKRAKKSEQTSCASFEKHIGGMTNIANYEPISGQTSIRCSATSCVFNGKGRCTAEQITVAGSQGAENSRDTECASFEMR